MDKEPQTQCTGKNHSVKLNETSKKDRSGGPEEKSPNDFFSIHFVSFIKIIN